MRDPALKAAMANRPFPIGGECAMVDSMDDSRTCSL